MAATLRVARVLTTSSEDNRQANLGALYLTDGTLLCGLGRDYDDPKTWWYRSTDNGATWSKVSETAAPIHNDVAYACHQPTGLILAPGVTLDYVDAKIFRSLNYGSSWATVLNQEGPTSPPFRTVVISQITTYGKTNAIATGQFEPAAGGPWSHFATSTDSGENWTLGPSVYREHNGTWGQLIANVGGGLFVAKANSATADSGKNDIWTSTDYGATWSVVGSITLPAGGSSLEPTALTIITPDIWLLSGIHNPSAVGDVPGLYRTTDAGATWTRITSSVIASWPSDGFPVPIWEVKRLTRDAVIMGLRADDAGTYPPWRISLDQGETWDTVEVIADSTVPVECEAMGAIVTANDGHIILPLFTRVEGGADRDIWRGTWVC